MRYNMQMGWSETVGRCEAKRGWRGRLECVALVHLVELLVHRVQLGVGALHHAERTRMSTMDVGCAAKANATED